MEDGGRWGARGARISGRQKTQAEGKRNETKRETGQRRATTSKVKCRKAKQGRPRWERGEGSGEEGREGNVKATNGMAKARPTTAQQQHVNDNVVALREAPTETSGWKRRECGGVGRPAKSINVMAQLEGSHPEQEPRHRPRPRPKHRPKHRPENENEREHENETRDRARCPMPSSGVGLV